MKNYEFPCVPGTVNQTPKGTYYLTSCGVGLIAQPTVSLKAVDAFLEGFDPELKFREYTQDPADNLTDAEQLIKFAGQLCYMSLGPLRTMNADTPRYMDNIKSSGHGSVTEHSNFTFLFWGTSRSLTHELVRHRAGYGFSQVSQRYVSGKVLRFVERPEYQGDEVLHERFIRYIDNAAEEYAFRADRLLTLQKEGGGIMTAERKTDLRKKVQQAARSCLPNETEAPIVVTSNVRGWRHFSEMRANEHAEIEIRDLAYKTYTILRSVSGTLFNDYQTVELSDGTKAVTTPYRKV